MQVEGGSDIANRPFSALDRARAVSQALSDAARLARVSKRSRRALASGGFQARRGARLARVAAIASFILFVLAPSVAAAIYYGFIASDQYVAEARFTVAGGEPPTADNFGGFTGIPAIAIIQDTQVVTDYIHSRAAVEQLEKKVELRTRYATSQADWLARFDPSKSVEKFLQYWNGMSNVSIEMPAGVVDLKVRAFNPKDAAEIASAVLEVSEDLINNLNTRMNQQAVAGAEIELERTSTRLISASQALESARNDAGLLDAAKSSDALNQLITQARASLLDLQGQYATELNYVSETAPQMRTLKARIDSSSAQIAELEAKMTTTNSTAAGAVTLANSMTKFDELDLERRVAEKLYAGASASLEIAHLVAERKFMYLNTFVHPVAPEQAQYPYRALTSVGIFVGLFAAWGVCCGLAATIRNYAA